MPPGFFASVTMSPVLRCSCSASWREMRIGGGSGLAGAIAAGTASAITNAAVNADARARFTAATARLLDKLLRPATRRNVMRRVPLVAVLAAGAATLALAQ